MPQLKKIVIQDFRNISLQEVEFSPNINCISGGNGEGKTNLLDAIWYLSMTKSAFSPSDRFNFRYGTSAFAVSGTYDMGGGLCSKFSIRTSDGEKKMMRDDKFYPRISEHIGVIPIVMVSPADTAMVSESGEERRKFVNAVLSQMSPGYLDSIQQYNRYLLQRNKALKEGICDDTLLDTFDYRLSATAGPVHEARKQFCDDLTPIVADYYRHISGGKENVGIDYRSDLLEGPLSGTLASCRDKDKALRFTSAGIQRDDFIFTMDGYPIRRCGSQGQQKSFLVALKFAQYELMKRKRGVPPIMLLDELFDKLDMDRVSNLLKMVADKEFGQIFLTDSNKTRIRAIVDSITSDRAYFETKGGVFTRINEQD